MDELCCGRRWFLGGMEGEKEQAVQPGQVPRTATLSEAVEHLLVPLCLTLACGLLVLQFKPPPPPPCAAGNTCWDGALETECQSSLCSTTRDFLVTQSCILTPFYFWSRQQDFCSWPLLLDFQVSDG